MCISDNQISIVAKRKHKKINSMWSLKYWKAVFFKVIK